LILTVCYGIEARGEESTSEADTRSRAVKNKPMAKKFSHV
jgi:hypothetical protein